MATMFSTPPGVYPAKGVVHLARRPNLNKKIGGFLAGLSAASIGGISLLAWGTYSSQLRFVGQRLGTGLWGKIATSILILGEAYVPLYFAFSQTLRFLQKQLFEDVLKEQGVFPVRQINGNELASMNAYMQSQAEKRAAERRSRHTVKGFALHAAQSTIVSAMTSPLASVVPFAPVLLSFTSGDKATVPFIAHYLRLRGLKSHEQQMAVADTHKLAYRQFGITAALLSAVPVASWGFAFSNTVGAALWAADMEKRNYDLFK